MHLPCPSRWPKLAQTQRSARCRVSASLPATLQRRCCLVTPGFLYTPGVGRSWLALVSFLLSQSSFVSFPTLPRETERCARTRTCCALLRRSSKRVAACRPLWSRTSRRSLPCNSFFPFLLCSELLVRFMSDLRRHVTVSLPCRTIAYIATSCSRRYSDLPETLCRALLSTVCESALRAVEAPFWGATLH